MKTIYDLELHENFLIRDQLINVVRVPGGWIYESYTEEFFSAVFVPFNNEFESK